MTRMLSPRFILGFFVLLIPASVDAAGCPRPQFIAEQRETASTITLISDHRETFDQGGWNETMVVGQNEHYGRGETRDVHDDKKVPDEYLPTYEERLEQMRQIAEEIRKSKGAANELFDPNTTQIIQQYQEEMDEQARELSRFNKRLRERQEAKDRMESERSIKKEEELERQREVISTVKELMKQGREAEALAVVDRYLWTCHEKVDSTVLLCG